MSEPKSLTLTRNLHERIRIKTPSGEIIWLSPALIKSRNQVRLRIQADAGVEILREELVKDE